MDDINIVCWDAFQAWEDHLKECSNGNPSKFMADYEDHKPGVMSEIIGLTQDSESLEDFISNCGHNIFCFNLANNLQDIDGIDSAPWLKVQSILLKNLKEINEHQKDFGQ